MNEASSQKAARQEPLQASPYGASQRVLHLAMAIGVILLAASGLLFQNRKYLGLEDKKLDIMFVHATIGYFFLAAFATRIALGFFGAEPLRFRHVVPADRDLKRLVAGRGDRTRLKFAGRSPLSRLLAGLLFVVIGANVLTGMTRAGTDLYFPPLGPFVQAYIAKDGVEPAQLKPGEGDHIDESRYSIIRDVKKPFGAAHYYGAWIIIGVGLLHMVGVVATEWSAPNDRRLRGRARLMLFGPKKAK
jgi:cytochrome b561